MSGSVSLVLHPGYRRDAAGDAPSAPVVARHLRDAADALQMAVIGLDGHRDADRPEKLARAARVREQLAEAVTALSRARIHVAGLHTYSVPAVMAVQPSADDELARLHQLTHKLLWHNHHYLPPRAQGTPLTAEEEKQLDRFHRGLRRQARIARVGRYQWLAAALVLVALGPQLGLGVAALGLGCALVSGWRLVRGDS
jgi:hypothetical protein